MIQANALVLGCRPLGERDLLVEALGEEGALYRLAVRGGQDARHPWLGYLTLWNEVEAAFEETPGREIPLLETCGLVRSRLDAYADPACAAYLASLARMARTLAHEGLECPALYRLFAALLDPPRKAHAAMLVYAALWALRLEGLLPDVSRCGRCRGTLKAGAQWRRRERVLLCAKCSGGKPALPPEAAAWLARALRAKPEEAANEISGAALARAARFIENVFEDAVGTRVTPLSDYRKMAA